MTDEEQQDKDFYDLVDAGMSTKELLELAEETEYMEYDVAEEMELIRALNLKFKIHNNYNFGVTDL